MKLLLLTPVSVFIFMALGTGESSQGQEQGVFYTGGKFYDRSGYLKIQNQIPSLNQPGSLSPPQGGTDNALESALSSMDELTGGSMNPSNQSGSSSLSSQPKGNISRLIEQEFPPSLEGGIVLVVYESPTMVVLTGNLVDELAIDYNQNLWKATDFLRKNHEFDIRDILVNGLGSEGNPERFYVIMTK